MAESNETRRKRGTLVLTLLILASFGLMVVELRSPDKVATARRGAIVVAAPFFQSGSGISKWGRSQVQWAVEGQIALEENRELRRDNTELRLKLDLAKERRTKLERERDAALPRLLEMRLDLLYANVIANSSQHWVHALVVDLGRVHGVTDKMPAVDYSGAVVGIVTGVGPSSSVVRLLCSPGFDIGALIGSTREQGMIRGLGRTDCLYFEPEMPPNQPQQDFTRGEEIISSGFAGSPYPKGLRIGTIRKWSSDEFGSPYAVIEPAASFNALDEVILIAAELRDSGDGVEEPDEVEGESTDADWEESDSDSETAPNEAVEPEGDAL